MLPSSNIFQQRRDVYERLSPLKEQVVKFAELGTVVVCGDFSATPDIINHVSCNIISEIMLQET